MKILCFFSCMILLLSTYAQSDSVKVDPYPVYSVGISKGDYYSYNNSRLIDFASLFSEHSYFTDISQEDFSLSSINYKQTNPRFSAYFLKYNPPSEKNKFFYHSRWLIGVAYHEVNIFGFSHSRVERTRLDTLTVENASEIIFIDSVIRDTHHSDYMSEQLKLNLAFHAITNPSKRWAFYAGVGLSSGFSINSKIKHVHEIENVIELTTPQDTNNSVGTLSSDIKTTLEMFDGYRNITFAGSIPFGFDFRIGEQNEFWRNMHLFAEFKPGVNVYIIPKIDPVASYFFAMKIGINFVLNTFDNSDFVESAQIQLLE
ncbi:MAG: hypothetical protein U9N51_07105 [Bacteroidota bacterium]|nr:hypothetical protein [Bacteroidota bacterium]